MYYKHDEAFPHSILPVIKYLNESSLVEGTIAVVPYNDHQELKT